MGFQTITTWWNNGDGAVGVTGDDADAQDHRGAGAIGQPQERERPAAPRDETTVSNKINHPREMKKKALCYGAPPFPGEIKSEMSTR